MKHQPAITTKINRFITREFLCSCRQKSEYPLYENRSKVMVYEVTVKKGMKIEQDVFFFFFF